MSVIPCCQNAELRKKIEEFAETLKTEAHKLGDHGLDDQEFYNSGLFRGAIERVRGQFSATMRDKREFVKHVLNYMQDGGYIADWESAGEANRHDYAVKLNSGKSALSTRMSKYRGTTVEQPLVFMGDGFQTRIAGILIHLIP